VKTSDDIDEHGMCCSYLVSVDSTTLLTFLVEFFFFKSYLVYVCLFSKSKIFWNLVRIKLV
jgi:hypothetical protein